MRSSPSARDHDRYDEHADLAQDEDAQHVDDVGLGAEPAEMEKALLRDDAADQESDQQDDGDRLQADAIEVMHGGGEPERLRPHEDAPERHTDRAQHVGDGE